MEAARRRCYCGPGYRLGGGIAMAPVDSQGLTRQPNMRVKLAAPTSKGIRLFVKTKALRRSLRAFR